MRSDSEMPKRVTARAPGRVNLIGEHTDYNDGFVFPMALPFATTIEFTSRTDRSVFAESVGHDAVSFTLDDDPTTVPSWGRYLAGMARFLADDGLEVNGFDAQVRTDIPVGASLSSSAALEVATGFGLCGLAGATPDPVSIAKLGQRVENEVIGIQSGIMDQLISALAVDGTALQIDCRSLETTEAQIPDSARVVIMDTMTRRELVDSEYDRRRSSCEEAAAIIGVPKLRDARLEHLELLSDEVIEKRARHVITENVRVGQTVDALNAGDLAAVGELMNESHHSLSNDYEVSSDALDAISAIAREHAGCFGARMTGGGFAGSAVALVDRDSADDFTRHVRQRWLEDYEVDADIWAVAPSPGASMQVLSD